VLISTHGKKYKSVSNPKDVWYNFLIHVFEKSLLHRGEHIQKVNSNSLFGMKIIIFDALFFFDFCILER
jgi:hypothetical protein